MRKVKLNMPKKYDRLIHASVIILIAIGTLMIISTSVGESYSGYTVVIKTALKQIVFVLISYFIMVSAANYFSFERMMKWIRIVGFVLVTMLIACFFFTPAGGAYSWIRFSIPSIGQITIQPSEFMKTFMIVCMACFVERARRLKIDAWTIIKVPFSFYMIAAILIFLQNDAGTLIVLSLICAICFLIPTHPSLKKLQKWLGLAMVVCMVLVVFLASDAGISFVEKIPFLKDHIVKRFLMASNPWQDEFNDGYNLIQSLYAFASGGWQGLGLGNSIQKMAYLPEAFTDYILAVTIEELGITGFLAILGGYSVIIYRLFKYALLSKKESHKILYIGTAMYLFIHFVFNVGGVSGLIPLTGVPLLFISSGSSSLMSICIALGICQGVLAKENREREEV